MQRRRFDLRGGRLQIEQCPPARWTRDVIGLENPRAGRLQYIIREPQRLPRRFLALHQNRVANSIAKQRADICRSYEQRVEKIRAVILSGTKWSRRTPLR